MPRQVEIGPGVFVTVEDDQGSPQLERFFAVDGFLAQRIPGYQPRAGQLELARAVETSIQTGARLVAEGPCGVGKSMAYGVPAALRVSRRANEAPTRQIAICTANIALQEQLAKKDIPLIKTLLETNLGHTFDFAVFKGWNNYYCPAQRITSKSTGKWYEDDPALNEQIEAIEAWVTSGEGTGDMSELAFVPDPKVWRKFSISSRECPGRSCSLYADCPAQAAKTKAKKADLVITNYHLLLSYAKLGITPVENPDAIICDEAHEIPDIARQMLGGKLSYWDIRGVAKKAARWANLPDDDYVHLLELNDTLFAEMVAASKNESRYKFRLLDPIESAEPAYAALTELVGDLIQAADRAEEDEDKRAAAELRRAVNITTEILFCLTCLTTAGDADYAITVSDHERPYVDIYRVHPQEALRSQVWDRWQASVVTSATMTARNNSFHFVTSALGMADASFLQVRSPFDFPRNALLVTPEHLAQDPNTPEYRNGVVETALQVIEAARGRTLLLFTSYKQMNLVADALDKRGCAYPWKKQKDMPRTALVEWMRQQSNGVLLGVASLWTGVDVPGDALSCLFIDKMPFPQVSDPVLAALQTQDRGWFFNESLPRVIITLKQGVGRLIRTVTDRGVIVVCDPRIHTKKYGQDVVNALPPMARTPSYLTIRHFLDNPEIAASDAVEMDDPLPW